MIVGLMGKAGSGKDTFAQELIGAGYPVQALALADPLKRICQMVYKFTEEQLWGPSALRNQPDPRYPRPDGTCLTPREALQRLGTEWGRTCYPETWTTLALAEAIKLLNQEIPQTYLRTHGVIPQLNKATRVANKLVFITDVRFPNEVAEIKKVGGLIVHIIRPDFVDPTMGEFTQHKSETLQDTIDPSLVNIRLLNDGSLDGYKEQCHAVLEALLVKGVIKQAREGGVVVEPLPHKHQDEVEVQTPFLTELLEKREADIKAGKLQNYDPSQANIPPFMRKKRA